MQLPMFQSIINLFFPKACSGCNAILLSNESVICTDCRHEIPLTNHHNIPNNEMLLKFYRSEERRVGKECRP